MDHPEVVDVEKIVSQATERSAEPVRPDQKVVSAQDWTGVDDPENPLNWSFAMKAYHTLIPALQCFTM